MSRQKGVDMTGSRGPISQPNNVRQLRGNPGRRQTPDAPKLPPVTVPLPVPSYLPAIAKTKWRAIAKELGDAGLLARSDAAALELTLLAYAAARRSGLELIAASSVVVHDEKNDRDMKHPAAQVFRDNVSTFFEGAKQLGITPVARLRMPLPDAADDDDNDLF